MDDKARVNEPKRSGRRLRWLAAGLMMALVTVWLARDLPRRLVQAVVADLSQGVTTLDSFRLDGWHRLDLIGLEIRRPAILPMVEGVAFDEVRIEGTFEDLLAGRVERVTLVGMDAHLTTVVELEEGPPHDIWVGKVQLEPATATVVGRHGKTTMARIEATLNDFGGALDGIVEARATEAEIGPVVELAALWFPEAAVPVTGTLEEIEAGMHLGEEPRMELRGEGGHVVVGGFTAELDQPVVEARLGNGGRFEAVLDADDAELADASRQLDVGPMGLTVAVTPIETESPRLRIDMAADLEMADEARLAVDWDQELGRVVGAEGRIGGFDLRHLVVGPRLEGVADLELRNEGTDLVAALMVQPRTVEAESKAFAVGGSTCTATAKIPLAGLVATPPSVAGTLRVNLDLPRVDGMLGDWKIPAVLPATAEFDGAFAVGEGAVLQGALTVMPAIGGRIDANGSVQLVSAGEAATAMPVTSAIIGNLDWSWQGSDLETLARLFDVPREAIPVDAKLSGRGFLRGPLLDPHLHADLDLTAVEVKHGDRRLVDGAAEIKADWYPSPRSPTVRVETATAILSTPDWEPIPVVIQATLSANRDLQDGTFEEASIELEGLGLFDAAGRWRRSTATNTAGTIDAEGTVRSEKLDLSAWQSALRFELGDLALRGQGTTELDAVLNADGWNLQGPVELAAGFSSEDGARVLEGLNLELTVEASGDAQGVRAQATGSSSGFLVLWDSFFADLSNLEASWRVDAEAPVGESPSIATGVSVPDGPVIAATLREIPESPGEIDYTLDLRVGDLARTHDRYLRAILEGHFDRPELGGALSAVVHGRIDPDADSSLAGHVHLEDVRWRSSEELTLDGLDLELPLDLRVGGGERLDGRLSFEELSFRGLRLPPVQTALWTENDGLALEDSLTFEILGGSITLARLELRDLFLPGRFLETSLSLDGLDLGRISRALEIFPLEGTVEGHLPRVRASADVLKVDGGGEIGVFGGTVRIQDISGTEILTPFPSLTLSAELDGIDLGRLTRRLDFGEMTGLLHGSITDCELFRNVPVRCSARFETAAGETSRTVDVKAINNLSILGTGAGTNVFDRGLQRFLDRYRYERLGVEIRLDNDVLLLRGLETRGDKELFMKGRFPFPIDIVNAQPGRTVSFQAMMRRLQSLDFSAVTTSP